MVEHIILPTAILVIAAVAVGARLLYIFVATAALARRGAHGMSSNGKYLLDGALVVLIIVLVWTGVRSWTNRNPPN